MSNQKNRRSLKNVVIKPSLQLRYVAIFFLFIGMIGLIILGNIYVSALQNIKMLEELCSTQASLQGIISEQMMTSYIFISGLYAAVTLLAFLYILRLSHRVFGPMVQINRHVQNLIDGNYTTEIRLRKHDEHEELANLLNSLAKKLNNKS